mgnify:CR=1 FL=1
MKKNILLFFILYATTILLKLYTSPIITQIYFLCLLLIFFFSKKDYFWFALFFFLIESSNLIFLEGTWAELPGYNIVPSLILPSGVDRLISFSELFIYIAFFKALVQRKVEERSEILFSKPLKYLALYGIFLVFYGLILGVGQLKFLRSFRIAFPPLMLFFSISILFKSEKQYFRFFYLTFASLISVVVVQFFEILSGQKAAAFLGIGLSRGVERPLYSQNMIIISFIGALFLLAYKKNLSISRLFLWFVIFLGIISFVLSGSRGVFISTLVMLFLFVITIGIKKKQDVLLNLPIIFLLILSIAVSVNPIWQYIQKGVTRTSTLILLLEGDLSAGGTLGRFTVRAPRVWGKYIHRPILGFGFSKDFYQYRDIHVGYLSVLLNGGIIGTALFSYFWFYFLNKISKLRKSISKRNPYYDPLLVLGVGLMGLLTIHFSSSSVFMYLLGFKGRAIMVTFFFAFSNFMMKRAKNIV